MTSTLAQRPAPPDSTPPEPPARRKVRRTPLTWYRGGGLWNLLFLSPMIFVFAFFSWSPIVQSAIMSLQKTNLIVSEWVGLDNYVTVLTDPELGRAVINTIQFALLALLFGYPIPLVTSTVRLDLEPILTVVRGELMFVTDGPRIFRMESGFSLDLSLTARHWFVTVQAFGIDFRYWVYSSAGSFTGFSRIFPLRFAIGHEF
jgi:hypothetical protein